MFWSGKTDPYKVLFPLGLLSAVFGSSLWILFQNQLISFYPRQAHGNIMFFAFLWSFICGFLMTAVPKMTSTFRIQSAELFFVVLSVVVQLALNIGNEVEYSAYFFLFQLMILIFFLIRRFLIFKKVPFPGFYFLPCAIAQGFFGVAVFYINQSNFELLYKFSGEALVLNLILGLGSRLIPVISRCPNALMPDVAGPAAGGLRIFLLALILNVGFVLESFVSQPLGAGMKLFVFVFMALKFFGLFKRPTTFSYVAYLLKLGIMVLILANTLSLFGITSLASLHLVFLGVFVLITIMIGSRVMLAHGQQDLNYETRSLRLLSVGLFIFTAAILRYLAGVNVSGFLMSASVYSFLFGVLLWAHKFLKIQLEAKSQS
jgi:uncharacterized protein involved in response to NO